MPPSLTREELTRHKVPTYTLSAPVTGWEVRPGGGEGLEIIIPAGAQMVSVTRSMCAKLLALYGDDRGVADVFSPTGGTSRFSTGCRMLPPPCLSPCSAWRGARRRRPTSPPESPRPRAHPWAA